MASCTATDNRKETTVSMGQIAVAEAPDGLKSILGSCIGLAIYHPRKRVGVLGHIVLPKSSGKAALPGKFADLAVPNMLKKLREKGVSTAGLIAKMAGGANMFGKGGPLQIGDANVEAVLRELAAARIRPAGKDVGGTSGRRVVFDCSTGKMTIEVVGEPPRVI